MERVGVILRRWLSEDRHSHVWVHGTRNGRAVFVCRAPGCWDERPLPVT